MLTSFHVSIYRWVNYISRERKRSSWPQNLLFSWCHTVSRYLIFASILEGTRGSRKVSFWVTLSTCFLTFFLWKQDALLLNSCCFFLSFLRFLLLLKAEIRRDLGELFPAWQTVQSQKSLGSDHLLGNAVCVCRNLFMIPFSSQDLVKVHFFISGIRQAYELCSDIQPSSKQRTSSSSAAVVLVIAVTTTYILVTLQKAADNELLTFSNVINSGIGR